MFGDGSIHLEWTGVEARPGIGPQVELHGKLTARGFHVGAVVQLQAEVTAWDLTSTYALLGTTTPVPFVLNWEKQAFAQLNPPPPDETVWDVRASLPVSAAMIEKLEERRQGKDFTLQIDTTPLLVDQGEATEPLPPARYAAYPVINFQDRLPVPQHRWTALLERFEQGASFHVLLPLPLADRSTDRGEVVHRLREARRKIDTADYEGSVAESRKALELLRRMFPASRALPPARERDPAQRVAAVLDALHGLASAGPHMDAAIRDWVPTRAEAVAIAASSLAMAQGAFAWIDRS